MDQVPAEGGAVLANLGMAVVNVPPDAAGMLAMEAGEDSAILSVEPEGVVYALSELRAFSRDYMRGFRDCAQSLYTSAATTPPGGEEDADLIEAAGFVDSPSHTWGLIDSATFCFNDPVLDLVGHPKSMPPTNGVSF